MEPATFALASLTLLATPGPTNTLLATSGAAVGVRRSLPLLAAELGGYLTAIAILRSVIGPVIAVAPLFGSALRLAAAMYLIYVATKLWRSGLDHEGDGGSITFSRVFVTTLLNPKAIIFAFMLLPADLGLVALWPWVTALAGLIFVVGGGWIVAGASLARGFGGGVPLRFVYRGSALALAVLAAGITVHALHAVAAALPG